MEWILIGIILLVILIIIVNKSDKDAQKKVYTTSDSYGSLSFDKKSTKKKNLNPDSFEGWFYDEVDEPINISKNLQIKYEDANKQITTREITIHKVGAKPYGGLIIAHCKLRNSTRTFRTDRIIECIDLSSGEYIGDIASYLLTHEKKNTDTQSYGYNSAPRTKTYDDGAISMTITYPSQTPKQRAKYEEDLRRSTYQREFAEKYKIFFKVIFYIVKCDGTFNKREKAIVREIFETLENNNPYIDEKFLEYFYRKMKIPSLATFKLNLSKLLKDETFNLDLYEITQNIIATQKKVHPNEQEVLEYIEKKYENIPK